MKFASLSVKNLALILSILLLTLASRANTSFTGVASQAMGGTGRAGVVASEVALLNPASFVAVRGYNLSTAYRDFDTTSFGVKRNFLIHASENQTDSIFPLAITYLKSSGNDGATSFERKDVHLTTGQVIFKNVAFGLDVARYTYTPDVGIEDDEWDLKMGFLYAPKEHLGFGLVFTNLLQTDFLYLKRGVEFGVNYLYGDFLRMALDVTYQIEDNPKDEGVIMVGVEHVYLKQIPLRFGFKWDDPNNENYWTLGLSWNAPKISFGYAYEKNVSDTEEYGHSVDLRIYF